MNPPRFLFPALLAALLSLAGCAELNLALPRPATAPAKPVTFTATGQFKPGPQRGNEFMTAEQRQLAAQAARRDALRNLTAQLNDFRLADGTAIGALIEQDDDSRAYVEGLVQSARVVETKTLADRSTQVHVQAELTPAGQDCLVQGNCPQPPGCSDGPLRKVLVTAFPLRYPEQIPTGNYMGWPQATAEELARLLNRGGRLLGTAAAQRFPFASAESAPTVERSLLTQWAGQERAQYVVAGMFRDFGMAKQALVIPSRQMLVEAYIYDGISGELVARREFLRQIPLSWELPKAVTPGTREFSNSRLGKRYYELLGDIGRWSERTVSCLPFSARVLQAEGRRLHIDVGSDNGVEPGMALMLTRVGGEPVIGPSGEVLTGGRVPIASVVVKEVQPRHGVAEITTQRDPPQVRPGDVLYGM